MLFLFGWGKNAKKIGYCGILKCGHCKNYTHSYIYEIANNINMMDDYICRLRELEYKLNNDLSEINKEISVWNEQLSIM